ncbi:MAG: FapA family protein [Candidatus Latescibacterota bacterium]
MAKKPPQRSPLTPPESLLTEIERFLEGGPQAVKRAFRPPPEPSGSPAAAGPARPPASPAGPQAQATPAPAPASAPVAELEVEVTEDGLQATLRAIHPQHSAEEVLAFLAKGGITHGVDAEGVRRAAATAGRTGRPVSDVVVARGEPPQPAQPPRLEYCHPACVQSMPRVEPVRLLLAGTDRGQVASAAGQSAWLVVPGTCLARRVESPGRPGRSVEGKPILPVALETAGDIEPRLEPGRGARLAPNGADLVAAACGYAGLDGERVCVLPPVWTSPDGLEACWVDLERLEESAAPAPEQVAAALQEAGITQGVEKAQVEQLCQGLASQRASLGLVPVARGRPPQAPGPGEPVYQLELGSRPGTFRPDGSVDFRQRNAFPAVRPDMLLAELHLPQPGQAGLTVTGAEIPVEAPAEVHLAAGENVRLEEADGVERLYATADGGATLTRETRRTSGGAPCTCFTIVVREVAEVDGDVGYGTGNLDCRGNVAISGSVGSGFEVHATGGVTVRGSVEAGARVQAGGDITVGQGVVGRETRVTAGGSITAKYVHDAQLEAGTEVLVGSYIHGARVRAGTRVAVEGLGGSGGGIVGGFTWAGQEIATRNLGSAHSTSTRLLVGVSPEERARQETLTQTIRQAEAMLRQLLEALGLPDLTTVQVRRLVARQPGRRKLILQASAKGQQLLKLREESAREQEALSQAIAQAAAEARVEVREEAHRRASIRVGQAELSLEEHLRRVRFCLDPQTGQVVWSDL